MDINNVIIFNISSTNGIKNASGSGTTKSGGIRASTSTHSLLFAFNLVVKFFQNL
jgi:hypothetical protein